MTVSVVVPARNEAGAIVEVVRRCRESTPTGSEVIVVDDGSSDATAHLALAAGARVVRLGTNRGKGVAIREGIAEARGDVVVFIDGDGQDWPEEIPALLAALQGDVQMVIGSRFLGTFDRGAITRLNRLGTRALTGVLNALFRTSITDPIAGFRAVRRDALDGLDLRASRYDIEVDLLLALLSRGGRVVEVPVRRSPRTQGATSLAPFRDGTRILGRILARRLTRRTP